MVSILTQTEIFCSPAPGQNINQLLIHRPFTIWFSVCIRLFKSEIGTRISVKKKKKLKSKDFKQLKMYKTF